MTRTMNSWRNAAITFCALFSLGILIEPAARADGDRAVFPPGAEPYGMTYGEWSATHWQWLFSLPTTGHPLFDTADCSAGQSGKVWFLGGTFSLVEIEPGVILGQATRNCTIPKGKALFFPIVSAEASEIEGNGTTEEELRDFAEFLADFIVPETLKLKIDGEKVKNLYNFRVQSPLFTFGPLPEGNVLGAPAGATSPSVSDGVFVMLKPLSKGKHKIHFYGEIDLSPIGGPLFIQDITYNIKVVDAANDDDGDDD